MGQSNDEPTTPGDRAVVLRETVVRQACSLFAVLLSAVVATFVWGAWVYFHGVTANVFDPARAASEPGSNVHAAARALGFSAVAVALGVVTILIQATTPSPNISVRRFKARVLMWLWVTAVVPVVAAAIWFRDVNFVRPDLVDENSSIGYLLMCISALLLVAAAAIGTVVVVLGQPFERWRRPSTAALLGAVGWAALVCITVVCALSVSNSILPMRDEFRPGAVADMTPRVPGLDMARAQAAPPAVASQPWLVTAAGLVGEIDDVVVAIDPFSGDVRWSLRKSGTPDGAWHIDVVGDGRVVLVRWPNLGLKMVHAYAADTGRYLWHGEVTDESGWDEVEFSDEARWTVRDPWTGDTQLLLDADTICPFVPQIYARGEVVYAECKDPDADLNEGNSAHTLVALRRSDGTELWRTDYFGYSHLGTETLDVYGCPKISVDLKTGSVIGNRPCREYGQYTDAGSYLVDVTEPENSPGRFAVVDRSGVRGPTVDLGPQIYVFDPAGGTRDHVFVRALDGRSDAAWLIAADNRTGAVEVLVGLDAMPGGAEPLVRAAVSDDGTIVYAAPWGVVIGAGRTPRPGEPRGWVQPQLVIPAAAG